MKPNSERISVQNLERDGAILEIQDGNHGEKHPKATDYVEEGIPFIMANNVLGNTIDIMNAAKIPISLAENLRTGYAINGDVLLTHKGTIGNTAIVETDFPFLMLTPQVTYYRTDPNKMLNRYLMYAFQEPFFQKTMKSLAQQATRPYIGITAQRKLILKWVPINEQQEIVDILSAYDDLIENNRRRIRLLEESARLLYKEWFVHLRFPGHEHVKNVDGVPKGWERTTMEFICDTVGGGTPSTKRPEYWDEGEYIWVVPTDVTRNNSLILLNSERKITLAGLNSSSARIVPPLTILMTSRASIGYFALMDKEVCTNQGFINIIPKKDIFRFYILFNLVLRVEEIRSLSGGSTYPEISKSRFRNINITMPSETYLYQFNKIVKPQINQILLLAKQTANLVRARDLLLPRLINGEFSV